MNPSPDIAADVHEPIDSDPVDLRPDTDADIPELDEKSMVDSVMLHLVSEHGDVSALHLDDEAASARHEQLHDDDDQDHPAEYQGFRPGYIFDLVNSARPDNTDDHDVADPAEPPIT